MSDLVCPNHQLPCQYICSYEGCSYSHILCQTCKEIDKQHFSQHIPYIYGSKQFLTLKEGVGYNQFVDKLSKGISNCQYEITNQKQLTRKQIDSFGADLTKVIDGLNRASKRIYDQVYQSLRKNSKTIQQRINEMKHELKSISSEKQKQNGLFGFFINNNKSNNIQAGSNKDLILKIITKYKSIFKIRAQLLSVHHQIKLNGSTKIRYKSNIEDQMIFQNITKNIENSLFQSLNRLKQLFESGPTKILDDSKFSANMLNSVCQPISNTTIITNQIPPNLIKVQFPKLSNEILQIINQLQPIPDSSLGLKDQGPFKYSDGSIYYGNYSNGQRFGRGKIIHKDGSYYEGYWKHDKPDGMGRIVTRGYYYEGQISKGKAHGVGKMRDHEKNYSGQWFHDMKHGLGKLQFKNKKLKYQGYFQQNLFTGKGKYETQQSIFEGTFIKGVKNGQGVEKFTNGSIFVGVFKQNKRVQGRFTLCDSSFYEGTFISDLPNGYGIYQWSDGTRYEGNWYLGQQHGEGKQISVDKKQRKGQWQKGQWKKWL